MQVLLRAKPARLICSDKPAWAAQPTRRGRAGKETLYIPAQHRHFTTEICLGLSGEAILAMDRSVFRIQPATLAIVRPEVRHSEGIAEWRKAYELLWMIPEISGLCKVQLSQYLPSRGWRYPRHVNFHSRCIQKLVGRFAKNQPPLAGNEWPSVRAGVLAVLGEALSELISQPAPTTTAEPPGNALVEQIRGYLDANLRHQVSMERLAQMSGVTPDYLNRLFRRHVGEPVHAYLLKKRLEQARRMCEESDLLIKQIALGVGFNDPLYFSRLFRKHHGCSPTDLRSGFGGRKP
jgi:AraC-like DNA-binding protein